MEVIGWSNSHPKSISSMDAGHTTPSTGLLLLKTKHLTFAKASAECFRRIDPGSSHVTPCGGERQERASPRLAAPSVQRCLGVLFATRKPSARTLRHATQSCNDASWSCMVDVYGFSPRGEWFRATMREGVQTSGGICGRAGQETKRMIVLEADRNESSVCRALYSLITSRIVIACVRGS